jgi:hypothetical protein
LSFDVGGGAENVLYSACVNYNCANVINSSNITTNSENVCWSKLVRKSFNIFYSTNIDNSSDIWFCSNCIGCHNCIDCDNLTNASYIINNIQLSKKEFLQKKEEILEQKADFNTKKLTTFARMGNINAINSTGKGLMNADNMQNGYMVIDVKDCRNLIAMSGGENRSRYIYDSLDIGINSLHNYAVTQWGRSEHIYCSFFGGDTCSNCYYCTNVQTCSFCLGCIGLKNKQFCIFNKQYTKEERHEKIDEIFTQMDKDGTL